MEANTYEDQMKQLQNQHRAAKKKMILGIIFIAVAIFVEILGYSLAVVFGYGSDIYIILGVVAVISLALLGVGVPFLIIGITGMAKSNRAISRLRAEQARSMPQQPAQAQSAYQTAYQQPAAPQQPVYQTYQPAAPQQPAYQAYQSNAGQEKTYSGPETTSASFDWQKYQPLDAGVSYDSTRDYKFHRAEGFVGSMPQTFVNRTFPKCPLCCSAEPYWTISQHNQMSWKGNLYLFKCSHCDGIISMSMPDVTTLSNGGGGVAANPTVGLTNLAVKASSGKQAGVVYGVIESVGRSGVDPACQGKEFKLEDLQQMFLRV